jgi:hypothetical protein
MTLTYLDTSAVCDWLEIAASAPTEKAARCGPQVEVLLKDASRQFAVSEITIIEALNAMHTNWRSTEARKASYDEAWARESQARLLEAVADGLLGVRPSAPGDLEHALMWVTGMTEMGRNFRAWDAVHLRIAVQWSRETDQVVNLITSDGDFNAFLTEHAFFAKHIDLTVLS